MIHPFSLNRKTFILMYFCLSSIMVNAQKVGIGTAQPDISAALEIRSVQGGLLPPRMTLQERNSIPTPKQGLIIFCTNCGTSKGEPQYFDGQNWNNFNGNPASDFSSVRIGTQIWSSTNLNVVTYQNGDTIPMVTNNAQWASLTTGAWCWYNNDSATYAEKYGRLYNWYAVNDGRGLAPIGWRIPDEADWNKLIKFLDTGANTSCILTSTNNYCRQSLTAGGKLKTTSFWVAPNTGATNQFGFSALPGGYRDQNGVFTGMGTYSSWWSRNSLEIPGFPAFGIFLGLVNNGSQIEKGFDYPSSAAFIRLIK
jgi:uncharacterized protein (TIGR02145 family)